MSLLLLIFLPFILVLCTVCSFIFSGGETSITASNTAKLHRLKLQGHPKAELILKLKNRQEQVVGSMLLGENILNIFSSAVSTFLAVELFGSAGVFISTILMTLIILIFADILPKTYALSQPEKMAMSLGKIILFFVTIFSPLIKSINKALNIILRLSGRTPGGEIISPSEAIRNLILLHKKEENESVLQKNLEVINNILDVTELHIDKIMTHRKDIFSLNADLPQAELINKAIAQDYSHVPLWKESPDNYIGILNTGKLISALKNREDIVFTDYIEDPSFIPETTLVGAQLHNFKINKNNFSVVVDEYGNLKGVITLSDILEEIIEDPIYSSTKPSFDKNRIKEIKSEEGQEKEYFIIKGKTPIRDVNRKLQSNFPTQSNQTFAGMIIDEITRIPEEEEIFQLYGYNIEILKKKGNIVWLIKLYKIEEKTLEKAMKAGENLEKPI